MPRTPLRIAAILFHEVTQFWPLRQPWSGSRKSGLDDVGGSERSAQRLRHLRHMPREGSFILSSRMRDARRRALHRRRQRLGPVGNTRSRHPQRTFHQHLELVPDGVDEPFTGRRRLDAAGIGGAGRHRRVVSRGWSRQQPARNPVLQVPSRLEQFAAPQANLASAASAPLSAPGGRRVPIHYQGVFAGKKADDAPENGSGGRV